MSKSTPLFNYVIFYFSVVVFYALYSVLLDRIYFNIDYGADRGILPSLGYYFFYILIMYLPATPLILFYNWIVINGFESLKAKSIIRVLLGLFTGFMVGLAMKQSEGSFYIGQLRPTRNIILFSLIGISVELLRVGLERFKRSGDNNFLVAPRSIK